MKLMFLDFETFYSQDYSLRKMTPVEYILDHRFEAIGCGVQEGLDGERYWVDGPDLPLFFADLDHKECAFVSHNAMFDMAICAWRYKFIPCLMIDTLGVARAVLGHKLRSLSLASVATELGIGAKGGTVHKVIGMSADAIRQAGYWDEYVAYCMNDVDLCADIYRKLVKDGGFPKKELIIMDMVIRCAIEPQFILDQNVLALHHHTIKSSKEQLLARVGVAKEDLMSNDKFAQALVTLGVEPPRKISLVTGKEAWAFSKTDPEFMELEEHEDEQVQALFAARLGLKSTLEETRTQRFINIGRLQWGDNSQGKMPMPLRYSGAHTHRLSGDWSLNVQNMPRGGALRRALTAPPGHMVVAADASQIEARIVAWICGQKDLVAQFARGEDVYSSFASKVFEKPINKKEHPAERFIGKTAILGLGYGLGWPKFQRTVKLQSKAQTGSTIDLSDLEAQKIVSTYREAYAQVPATWRSLNNAIQVLATGEGDFKIGPCEFSKGEISLPSGLALKYHELSHTSEGWAYTYGGKPKRLYGGSLLENIVQALARIVVMDTAVRVRRPLEMMNVRMALQVHDELIYVPPEDLADYLQKMLCVEMRVRPSWAPDLPLDAEAGHGMNYGETK